MANGDCIYDRVEAEAHYDYIANFRRPLREVMRDEMTREDERDGPK